LSNQERNAIVYCQGAFNTPNGKTAHGLVRFSRRYRILCVVDSRYTGLDAGLVLDGRPASIPIHQSVETAVAAFRHQEQRPTHLVVGLAPDGGRLTQPNRQDIKKAIEMGLNVVSGLHDFLSEDPEILELSARHRVTLNDIRKPPPRNELHFFSSKIESVDCLKIAILGTDSAIGKRTTAWLITQGLERAGYRCEMVGTGQTAWMQGARYSIILDSLVNDFVSGEIEHAVWSAWKEQNPDVVVIEGQGSLMNPAYPGGFEILAAGRPDIIILQHAPARREYDGFPGYALHPPFRQIQAIETISDKPVVAITLNHENIDPKKIDLACTRLEKETGLPVFDILKNGPDSLVTLLKPYIKSPGKSKKSPGQGVENDK
jgi:uncharacterized NAD-dependent epimerase/dehydratase family protein